MCIVALALIGDLFLQPIHLYAQQSTATSPTTMPLADYLAAVGKAYQELRADPSDERTRAIQKQLAAIQFVTTDSGHQIDLLPLLGEADSAPPSPAAAQARLLQLIEQVGNGQDESPTAQLARLSEIFAGAAFVQKESLWQRFWRWLRSWLPDLSMNRSGASNSVAALTTTVIGYLIIGVGAVLLAYLLSIWLQNLLGSFLGGSNRGRRLTPDGEYLNAAEAKEQAEHFARSGSFREAVRRLYLAALLTLDERSLLHYNRSNTNREVLATIRNNPTLYQQLLPVVETFDDVWYGVHEPDRATFDQYKKAVETLEGKVP